MPEDSDILLASCCGVEFARILEEPARGYVQSVFRRACNIRFSGGLIAVVAPELPMASWTARLGELPVFLNHIIEKDMPVLSSGACLHIGRALTVDLGSASVWTGDVIPPGKTIAQQSWESLEALARDRCWPGLCALFAPDRKERADSDIILGMVSESVSRMLVCRAAGNHAQEAVYARRLIGLGPGLTPAGDDFLGGYLAGCFAQSCGGSEDRGMLEFSQKLFPRPDDTSAVAARFLEQAVQGSFSEHLVMLSTALAGSEVDSRLVRQLGEKLLEFGASSGADALAGLMASGIPGQRLVRDRLQRDF